MVKAALLYADDVVLASPHTALLLKFNRVVQGSFDQQLRFVADVVDSSSVPPPTAEMGQYISRGRDLIREYLSLRAFGPLDGRTLLRIRELRPSLQEFLQRTQANYVQYLSASGVDELGIALGAGLLQIHDLAGLRPGPLPAVEDLTAGFFDFIAGCFNPSAMRVPLFDATTSIIARDMMARGTVEQVSLIDGTEVALAASWLGDLPGLPEVPMEVLLEIRDRIQDSRTRFRGAVAAAAADVSGAAFDPPFGGECERLYRELVAPAVREVEDRLSDRSVTSLLKKVVLDPSVVPAALAFGFQAMAGSLERALLCGLGAKVVTALLKERQRRSQADSEARSNEFFLIYDAREQLAAARQR